MPAATARRTGERAVTARGAAAASVVRSAGPVERAGGVVLGAPLARWRDAAREELALPRGVILGTGHQAEWWHPGIVAKFAWASGRSAELGLAAPAWLIVDTDVRDPLALRVPVRADGVLQARVLRIGGRRAEGTVACARRASPPEDCGAVAARCEPPCAGEGLRAAWGAAARHAGAADAAEQVTLAQRDLLPALGPCGGIVRTSRVLSCSLGRAIAERAAADPDACARAFNCAVRLVPRVARPLDLDGPAGPELPFWTDAGDGTRRAVSAGSLRAALRDGAPLWPRAFLTSVLARTVLCDRFVHGLGGEAYERATEAFARDFLGAELPPFDVATATARLPFAPDRGPAPLTEAELRRRWFDPEGAGPSPSLVKQAHLDGLAALPRGSVDRREAWKRMHADLAAARDRRDAEFRALSERAAADRARAAEASLRADRTWAAVLHPPERETSSERT